MDISGAQLNSAAISAYNTQLQTSPQPQRESTPSASDGSDGDRRSSSEVTLSQEGRQRAAQDQTPAQAVQPHVSTAIKAPVQPSSSQQAQDNSSSNDNADNQAAQVQAAELQRQQSSSALANASTYTARVAAQSYSRVSSF